MRALAVLGILLLAAAPARAWDCEPTTSEAQVMAAGFYAHFFLPCQLKGAFGCSNVAIYGESNGLDGLQRNDGYIDDTCGGEIFADTLVFIEGFL